MVSDWIQGVSDALNMSPTSIGVVAGALVIAAATALGWIGAVRRKARAVREEQDRARQALEAAEQQWRSRQTELEQSINERISQVEQRAMYNLEQSGRMADERVQAKEVAALQAIEDARRAADDEIRKVREEKAHDDERLRVALAERADLIERAAQAEQALRASQAEVQSVRDETAEQVSRARAEAQAELDRLREELPRQIEQVRAEARHEMDRVREEAARQIDLLQQQATAQAQSIREEASRQAAEEARKPLDEARHALEEARAGFAASLAEKDQRHGEESARHAEEQARHAAATAELKASFAGRFAEMEQQQAEHARQVERLQAMIDQHAAQAREAAATRSAAETELRELKAVQARRLNRIKRVWDEPPLSQPPRFVPAAERKTRFVSVANLKGGVGKTTIAGNAGVSLACRGHRVLMVDLDFQGSLTQVAVERATLTSMVKRYETARALFERPLDEMNEWLERIIRPVECMPKDAKGKCDVIGAWNDLADVELREEARWILQPESDARYRIREIFHRPEITDNYDYVIFDCPPRLTTAAVNALAASDGVIIPIMLDWQSAAPILYMLRRLRDLKPVLTGARVIGMVANQVRFNANNKPIQQMQSIFEMVCKRLDAEHLTAEDAFRVMVKAELAIGSDVNAGRIAAARPTMRPLFHDLVTSIERVTRHESLALV